MKHTPGPWSLIWGGEDKVYPYVMPERPRRTRDGQPPHTIPGATNAQGYMVAAVRLTEDRAEWEANARLIAAAPDMAEVLRYLFDYAELDDTDRERIRLALAKAEGK